MGERGCPQQLVAMGPGSQTTRDSGAVRVTGLWRLDCDDGITYDDRGTQVMQINPGSGTVLTAVTPHATSCFDAACKLPPDLCLRSYSTSARAVSCQTGQDADLAAWAMPSVAATVPVVVDGRVLKANPVEPLPQSAPAAPVASPATPGATPMPVASPSPVAAPVAAAPLGTELPPAPAMPCVPTPALTAPSHDQVHAGNESAVVGDWEEAISNYAAAITIEKCNAFAWADLGEALLVTHRAAQARSVLTTATSLMPQHYQAWANLGLAAEALGDRDAAAAAFERALRLRPGLDLAEQGLARTGG